MGCFMYLNQESLDTIVRLENTLKLEKLKTESLVKEKRMLEQQLKFRILLISQSSAFGSREGDWQGQ